MRSADAMRTPAAAPARGSRCDLATLLALRAAAATLDLGAPRTATARQSGTLHSNARGRGMEFEEVREYVAGDDTRSIDWRVTARTGRTHTKVFREERERPVYVCIDQRSSLFFGSRQAFKSVQAAYLGALLAWAALARGDRLGGLVFGDATHHEIKPRRSRRAVFDLLRSTVDFNHRLGIRTATTAPVLALADALTALRRIARPGSLVLLCSDFDSWDEAAARQLHLLSRHVEITGFAVHDALERELPGLGRGRVSDGRAEAVIDTADAGLRTALRQRFDAAQARVQDSFRRIGAPLHALATDQPALPLLQQLYRPGRRR